MDVPTTDPDGQLQRESRLADAPRRSATAPPPRAALTEDGAGTQFEASGSLASIIQIAERSGRTDLATRIESSRKRLQRTGIELWVVGEHKKGKSSLVNALLNADVCPVDPVWSTVLPIRISGADALSVEVVSLRGEAEASDLEQLHELATERGNAQNVRELRHVSVQLPRRLLGSGITFVDAPGVGGLESAVGSVTLAAVAAGDGVVYVTDCSQELTSTELSYLRALHDRVGRAICVMTKRDLYLEVETIHERNRAHLDAQGLEDVPLVTVSSTLHLLALAEQDEQLEAESGFAELFDALHDRLWRPARQHDVSTAGRELAEVATHLSLPVAAELGTGSGHVDPADQARRLEDLRERLRAMQQDSAGWQQRLSEGFQEVLADVEHDLRERLRNLNRMAEARIDATDDRDALAFEGWLRKSAIDSITEHYTLISQRAADLTEEVAGRLRSFDRAADFRPDVVAPESSIGNLHIAQSRRALKDGFFRRVVTTGQGYTSGFVLTSSVAGAGALIGGPFVGALFPFLALPVAGLMAKRSFGDDRERRDLTYRAEVKRTASKYLDEVGFIIQRDSRATVRRLHRETRAHFAQRTEQLQRTIAQTIEAAQRAEAAARSKSTATAEQPSPPAVEAVTSEVGDMRTAEPAPRATAVVAGASDGSATSNVEHGRTSPSGRASELQADRRALANLQATAKRLFAASELQGAA